MSTIPRARFLASVLAYAGLAAFMGREVLANLSTRIANDAGDPMLTAAILHWNARHVPWTDAWWQLPIFYPTRDALAFSEHLLGLSAVAAPIDWLTGDPLLTYNLVTLLTFVLSGATMYLLVHRLTGSAAGAFIAGLAFGFAPFRISQLPHIQMLAAFWAPLALLGLHAYLDSGRRRWLVVYGAAWALQAAANGYALVFFSVLVGLWVLWFVVARGRWRELASIAAATVVAAVPLAPILYVYITVHARHGFERGIEEIRTFSADVAAVLCAPPALTFWGWVRVQCGPEGELFPGVALFTLAIGALATVLIARGAADTSSLGVRILRRLLFATAAVYAAVIVSVLVGGPWRIELGFVRASAASLRKPVLIMLVTLILALVLTPGARAAARRSSTTAFYLLAALVTWLLALGPTITLMGESTGYSGPFSWLMALPGAGGLRVPARFWLMTAICLSVAAGIFVSRLLAGRSRPVTAAALAAIALGVAADGWVDRIGTQPAPPRAPDERLLRGQIVVELPVADYPDIAAQWRAVTGGWRTINGYSGFGPSYYNALKQAARFEEDAVFTPFVRDHDLHVVVAKGDERLIAVVERQPGVVRTAENDWAFQYRLPRHGTPPRAATGAAIPIVELHSECAGASVLLGNDGDETTRWVCPPGGPPQEFTIDLGREETVGTFVQVMGRYSWEAPRWLIVDTSLDHHSWSEAWNGSVLELTIEGGIRDPRSLRVEVPLAPRQARYVRVRAVHQEEGFHLTLPEAEVRRPSP